MPTMSPTWDDPYLFIGGSICVDTRCDCSGEPIDCVGSDVYITWRYVNLC